ncbi:MAG: glycosyltransferase family 4 protein, partial [Lentimicrobium sp.]|nr:glycosyltransferase family 4 protein [Lentimicrobium sp.]
FQKGPEYFIEAAYKVLQRDPNVRFVMAGTGDLLEKMIRRVAQLRISTKFHFTGFLRGDNVDRMFAMSDVYVMPSVSEPFGISPLEAMRSNVPVVISKQSGVAEVLQHALKVDFWDIDAMADAIYALLQYNSLSSVFSKYGAQEVENLKWENAARLIKDVYEQANQK